MMLLNYIKISYRNLKKRWPYTLINIFGLSLGLSCFLLLIAYTNYEESYDDFQENKDQLYRVIFERYEGEELVSASPGSMPGLGNRIKEEILEIEGMSRFTGVWGSNIVKNKQAIFDEEGLFYADSDFFKMFSFDLTKGNPSTALQNPYSIVLTESIAEKYFGKEDPLNKELEVANQFGSKTYNVTAVVKDPPKNTSFNFKMLCSFNSINKGKEWFENSWMYWAFPTILSIKSKADMESVKQQFPAFIKKYKIDPMEADITWKFDFQPIKDVYLKSDFRIESTSRDTRSKKLSLLKVIALLILLISWVNYVNLSTASSTERANEIGVRKAIGAYKRQISTQFLIEASLINITATLLAIGFVFAIIKPFSELLELEYSTEILMQPIFWFSIIPIVIIGIIASGLYPAFVLASFNPTEVLSSKTNSSKGSAMVRKILVGVQFTISILLIACTTIMIHQNNFMKQKDLGVNIDDVIVINKPELLKKKEYKSRLSSFVNELQAIPEVSYISASYGVPSIGSWGLSVWKNSKGIETQKTHTVNGVDANYIPTYDLTLLAGRNFDKNRIGDENTIVISKKSLKILGFEKPEDALGVQLKIETFKEELFEIIGVIDDYHHHSLQLEIEGMILMQNKGLFSAPKYFSMKLGGNNPSFKKTMIGVEKIYNRFFPGDIFEYNILKDKFQKQYAEEDRNQSIFTVFSILAIFLACIGILGLSSLIALLKTRDIAIRKVLGASKIITFWLLSKEFLGVLIVASVVAIPIVMFLMDDWLADFPYRIDINVWHFPLAIFSILFITLTVVLINLYKVSMKKPVDVLKTE